MTGDPESMSAVRRSFVRRWILRGLALLLAGCAAQMHPDFENVYERYNVPEELVVKARENFSRFGLKGADVMRDRLGRLQLAGRYENEDEVDRAFVIVQNLVGLQATSMVYPTEVRVKAWEQATAQAFERFIQRQRPAPAAQAPSPGGSSQAGVTHPAPTASPGAPGAPKGRKFALIVGIGKFSDPDVPPLPGAEKDASTLAALLLAQGGYEPSEIAVLRNAQATRAGIRAQLKRLAQEPGPADTVFVFIASHGLQPIPDPRVPNVRKYPVLAYDSRTSSPVAMHDTALHDTHLIELVRSSRAGEVVVVVDTCFSGNVFSKLPDVQLGGAASEKFIRRVNGGELDRDAVGANALARRWVPQPAGSVGPQAGTVRISLMSASGPGEESRESDGVLPAPSGRPFDGGLFTQSFAEGLRIYRGDVSQAFAYSRVFVSLFVREKTRGLAGQTPQILIRPDGASINVFRRGREIQGAASS